MTALARALAALTFVLLLAGGLVTSTGSGLAVPDWPLSFGTLFPPMRGGVRFEHTHRLIAGAVLLLTVALAVAAGRRERTPLVRRLAYGALAAVLLQAVLGGTTVLLKLPASVSVAHACLAQFFFALVMSVASLRAHPEAPRPAVRGGRPVFTLLAAAVYAQIALGAVVRHTGAGLEFPDFPLANGSLFPALNTFGQGVNFAHRAGAAVVLALVAAAAFTARRARRASGELGRLAVLLPVLACVQAALGAFSVWGNLPVLVTTAHVGTGGLLFAAAFRGALETFRSPRR